MTCLINTLIKNFLPNFLGQKKNLKSNCSALGCLIQYIYVPDINTDGRSLTISDSDIGQYDAKFISCLLSCKNGLQTSLIVQNYNTGRPPSLYTNIYPVILTATSTCNGINVGIIGNYPPLVVTSGPLIGSLYSFIFGCDSCNNCNPNTGNNRIDAITTLKNCEKCITFFLVQKPNIVCSIITIPGNQWFDISNYIDTTGTIDSLGYYYFNTCNYDSCKEFDIVLNIPNYNNGDYQQIPGFIKINKCGPTLNVCIRICKTVPVGLYSLIGNNEPSIITGACIDSNSTS